MNRTLTVRKQEQGFTLVELAIVMIIIGLLIGGILKGQELIANARITSTVAQIKGLDAATSTFQDKYNGMPGDLANATNRLQNCTAAPCVAGGATLGNNRVDSNDFTAAPGAGSENEAFFVQLNAADLLNGVNPLQVNAATSWGGDFPVANISGGFMVAYAPGATTAQFTAVQGMQGQNIRSGHYLALSNNPGAAVDAVGTLTPNQSFRIDSKLDDGSPVSGSVFPGGAATCINGNIYNENVDAQSCNLYIRFHQ